MITTMIMEIIMITETTVMINITTEKEIKKLKRIKDNNDLVG